MRSSYRHENYLLEKSKKVKEKLSKEEETLEFMKYKAIKDNETYINDLVTKLVREEETLQGNYFSSSSYYPIEIQRIKNHDLQVRHQLSEEKLAHYHELQSRLQAQAK